MRQINPDQALAEMHRLDRHYARGLMLYGEYISELYYLAAQCMFVIDEHADVANGFLSRNPALSR